MGDELTVFSWNLQKKSYKGLTSNSDTVNRVVNGIVQVVNGNDKKSDAPFVGFLLEIVGSANNVKKICTEIGRKYKSVTGKKISVTHQSTGGSSHTRESIITLSRGARVVSSKFDVRRGLADVIEQDRANADRVFREREERVGRRLRSRENHPYASRPDHFRRVNRESDWFRDGAIAEVTHGGRQIKIASIHAPGPDMSNKVEDVVDTIVNSAANQNVDILIGDLNRRGTLPANHFEDLSVAWKTGTTFGKKDTKQLGKTRWDRVLARNDRKFGISSPDPVPITRPANLGSPLTDHALVYARVKADAPGAPRADTNPFAPLAPAPGAGGADLRSLEASKALVRPADPTLLYAAASDRKSTAEQMQKQLEDNPLLNPSTEPASDPLSPPSATSPLTEPPPTTGADTAMEEEGAEAMEAMAAEGEEVAEVAELVLL